MSLGRIRHRRSQVDKTLSSSRPALDRNPKLPQSQFLAGMLQLHIPVIIRRPPKARSVALVRRIIEVVFDKILVSRDRPLSWLSSTETWVAVGE